MSWDLILLVIAGAVTVALVGEGLLIAIDWLTERSGRRPQAVEPLGMRIARLEHDCALEPPFDHPAGCPGCAPGIATIERERFYRERALEYARWNPGVLLSPHLFTPNEVREMRDRWARAHSRPGGVVLGPEVTFQESQAHFRITPPEPKAQPGTARR